MTSLDLQHRLPVPRNPTIVRSRLLESLTHVLGYKLTLVAAPPGYGKTTIVAQFALRTQVPVAWHMVEERERDLPNLLTHSFEALSSVLPNFVEPKRRAGASSRELAVLVADQLRNAFVGEMIYVLDDIHHVLGSPEAEAWLQAFIDATPPNVHIILVGRALPPLPIVDLVAHREVLALGQEQLRFSFEEIQRLAAEMQLVLSPLEIQKVMTKFDGWAAGCILALQPLPEDIASLIFGGRHTPETLFDSLAEVMLHAQDGILQDFLLASSTLARMTPLSCQEGLQLSRSRENLAEAVHRNVFVSEVAGGLSYHPLFRDFLQRHLKAYDPNRFVELHRRAGRWFEEHEQLEVAFDHYVNAGLADAASAIAERAAPTYLAQGKPETVLYWRSQLAEADVHTPQLLFICAAIFVYRYQYDLAEQALMKAEQQFQSREDRVGVLKVKLAHANMDNLRGEPEQAVVLTTDAVERFTMPPNMRGYAQAILGRAYLNLGSLDLAMHHLETALPLYRATEDTYAVAHLLLALEIAYLRVGRFDDSSALLHEALGMLRALGSTVDLLVPLNNLGYSYHLLGDYDQAVRVFEEGLQIASSLSEKRGESYLLGGLADLKRDLSAYDDAIALYRKALHNVGTSEPAQRCLTLVNYATLRRWQGNLDDALVLANEAFILAENHRLPTEKVTAQVCLCAVRAQQGEPKKAHHELEQLAEELRKQAAPIQRAQTLILCASAALLAGDTLTADRNLKSAVEGVSHETQLQPSIAEIVHTPLLNAFVHLHRLKYPALINGTSRLEPARVNAPAKSTLSNRTDSAHIYSLRLWMLGQEGLERDGVSVPVSAWRSTAARELFFYLLLKGATTREQLGLVLWEESSSEQLRGSFHTTLHRARSAVGTNTIRFEDDLYFVAPDVDVWCDAIEFGALVQKARLSSTLRPHTEELCRKAVRLYTGELLPPFDAPWIVPYRESLHQMFVEALLTLATCIRIRGDFDEALATFRRAEGLDPYREEIHRSIITCYAAMGERSLIHREVENLTRLLDTELGVAPSEETITLAQSLLTQS